MWLIRLLFEPSMLFTEMQNGHCVPPLFGCFVLSLCSYTVAASTIGPHIRMDRVQALAARTGIAESILIFGLNAGQAIVTIMFLLLVALVVRQALYGLSIVVTYGSVLGVCSYAAFAREAARLVITLGTVAWCHVMHFPLTPHTGVAADGVLATWLDLPALGFLVLVAIGLSESIDGLRLPRAAMAVVISWLVAAAVAVLRGHSPYIFFR